MRADGQEPDRRRERRTSEPTIAKSKSIKGAGRRFGGCAPKANELTSGGLPRVVERRGVERRQGKERSELEGRQKSAEGKVVGGNEP